MTQDIRICFVGDSFVNGTGDETALGWAGRLSAEAAQRGAPITYYNLGVRRETSRDIRIRWERECAPRLPASCDGRIVLSCGVNDTMREHGRLRVPSDESIANVREILGRAARSHRVLLVGPPPIDDDEQNERIEALSSAFAREAEALTVPFIELYAPLVSDRDYRDEVAKSDGAHPRSAGYAKMAAIIGSAPSSWFRSG